jgi:hypothetical protein
MHATLAYIIEYLKASNNSRKSERHRLQKTRLAIFKYCILEPVYGISRTRNSIQTPD